MGSKIEKISRTDYFVATLFLACGGNQLLTENKWYVFFVAGIMLILTINAKKQKWNRELIIWEIAFITLAFIQILFLPTVSLPAYINFAMKLFAGFLMVNYLGVKFRYAYFRVLVFFAAISLVLWAIYPIFHFNFGIPVGMACKSWGFWTFYEDDFPRNQGMFWESGAYQGYIMLVPILFIGELKELWRKERISCLILIAALLSTTSTTGYIAFMFVVGMYLQKGIKKISAKLFLLLIFVVGSFYAVTSLDFLGDKILSQYDRAQSMTYNDDGAMQSRMGTMYIDLLKIEEHPIIGNSFDLTAKYGEFSEVMSASGNGLTGFICTLGIPFFLFYLIGVYKKLPSKAYFKFVAIITILLVFYGENFYNFIPYWSLLFVSINVSDIVFFNTKKLSSRTKAANTAVY